MVEGNVHPHDILKTEKRNLSDASVANAAFSVSSVEKHIVE